MPGNNQFGGLKGSSTSHYLAEAWTYIMRCLDQEGSTCSLVSIDFAKAFNTMQHQACLQAFAQKVASGHSIEMLATFLRGRKMRFKIGNTLSTPRPLKGGSPQGTLLGNFMFIITTDSLEEKPAPDLSSASPECEENRMMPSTPRGSARGHPTTHTSTPLAAADHLNFQFSSPESVGDDPGETDLDASTFMYLRELRHMSNQLRD